MAGHSYIMNLSSLMPFIFTFNPEMVNTTKKINYAVAPNIGGAYKKRYFSGFDAKDISFKLVCIDKTSPVGVSEEIAFFEQLREPDAGFFIPFENDNFPPPQVLFQFGQSFIPLVWDVLDVKINESHFYSDPVRGVIGIPKKCEIDIKLGLDEGSLLNQANKIAKKVEMMVGAIESITRDRVSESRRTRREQPYSFNEVRQGAKKYRSKAREKSSL